MLQGIFPSTTCAGDRPRTKYNGKDACMCPNMAYLLSVVTLRETSLSFVRLYPDRNMAKAIGFNISWEFDVLGDVM
jgi:hypothetical protein